jgi:4-hydroxy-tetrahydrodipicolinate reductase
VPRANRIQVAILGAQGRLGSLITQEIESYPTVWGDPFLVTRSTPQTEAVFSALLECDLIIDASLPSVATGWISKLQKHAKKKKVQLPSLLVGSTGWTPAQLKVLKSCSHNSLVLKSDNFSIGIGLLKAAILSVAAQLAELGFESTLIETHHRGKKDSPSGTARMLCEAAKPKMRGNPPNTISIRSGTVVGRHIWNAEGNGESLIFSHEAHDRRVFACGAAQVGQWLLKQRKQPASFKKWRGKILSMDAVFNSTKTS